jgi:hypothetical protein
MTLDSSDDSSGGVRQSLSPGLMYVAASRIGVMGLVTEENTPDEIVCSPIDPRTSPVPPVERSDAMPPDLCAPHQHPKRRLQMRHMRWTHLHRFA